MTKDLIFDSPIIVALDFSNPKIALNFAKSIDPKLCKLKVGKELFAAGGPSIVERLQNLGFAIFLDLKFHDIPKTVSGALKQAAHMGVWMVNVHSMGGRRMLLSAKEALEEFKHPPILIAVTILTSLEASDLSEVGIHISVEEQVLKLAKLSKDSGCNGVVCSAQEASVLRHRLGNEFILVSPGIRLTENSIDDQRRVVTPLTGFHAGVNYLVLGRTITLNSEPLQELERIYKDIYLASDR